VTPAQRAGAVIAIDHGTKKSGFAVADALRITTEPLEPFRGPGDSAALLDHVAGLLAERDVSTLLVGLPRLASGDEGLRAADVRAFAARLAARFPGVDVVLHDEHLTTKAAEDLLREAGHRGLAARARRDSWSALVLLRDWLAAG